MTIKTSKEKDLIEPNKPFLQYYETLFRKIEDTEYKDAIVDERNQFEDCINELKRVEEIDNRLKSGPVKETLPSPPPSKSCTPI